MLKDLNLDVAKANTGEVSRLASRLSDIAKVLQVALDVKNHGVFVPVPSMFGSSKRTVSTYYLLADLALQELAISASDQKFEYWLQKATSHSRDMTHYAKWYYALGLGMVPLPTAEQCISGVILEGSRALEQESELQEGACDPEKLISLAYLLLACRVTERAISEISECTGAREVYSICHGKPKWISHNISLLASFNTPDLADKAISFIYNDLYDLLLTLKHVRLRSCIKKALSDNEDLIRREVEEYRYADASVRRRLQAKTSLSGTESRSWTF